MSIIAYIRVSTLDKQDTQNQKFKIMEYAHNNNLKIDRFMEMKISTTKTRSQRGIDDLIENFIPGDTLIVTELSRLGRSTFETINIIRELFEKRINLIFIDQSFLNTDYSKLDKDPVEKAVKSMMFSMFSIIGEMEREYTRQRIKNALARAKAEGKQLGRPKGTVGKSKLDKHQERISELLELKVPKKTIASMLNTTYENLRVYLLKRDLDSLKN